MVWNVVDTRFFDYTNDENPDTVFSEKKLLTLVERIQDAFTGQAEIGKWLKENADMYPSQDAVR